MAHARRVPDPITDLEVDKALQRLRDDLAREDTLVTQIANPFAAAAAHLSRCKPDWEAEPSMYPRFIGVPTDRERCCGKALAIKFLAGEARAHPTVQPMYEAIVATERLLTETAELLDKPLPAMLRELDAQQQRESRAGVATKPRMRRLTISRPAFNPPTSWLVDGLQAYYRSAPPGVRPRALQEQLLLLLNALQLAVQVGRGLEQRLRSEFILEDVHLPVLGAGRPKLLLLNELTQLLVATGHSDEEISKLLPDGRGDRGAVDRVRSRVPAGMRAQIKKELAKRTSAAEGKPPKKGRGNPGD